MKDYGADAEKRKLNFSSSKESYNVDDGSWYAVMWVAI